jgi:crotonobetainyl-CoA:carnitine CoA-transferase CaiB-like acyl-CoA transferase
MLVPVASGGFLARDTSSLTGLRVVDYAGSVAGAYCARMFAIQGAEVIVVGDGNLTAHQRRYLRSETISMRPEQVADLDPASIDVVIESSATCGFVPRRVASERTVQLAVTPFGSTGPYASWRSSDLVDYALSGHSYLYGAPDRAPLPGPPGQPAVAAGLYGFVGAMAALFARDQGHGGQLVEVNHHQVMVALHQMTLLRWNLTHDVLTRRGNRYTGQGQPNGPYPCRDGWIAITCVTNQQADALLAVTGLMHLMDLPGIESPLDFQQRPELLDGPLLEWLAEQDVDDVVDLFQAMRIPACPLRSPVELLDDPHLIAREFFTDADGAPEHQVPGPPFAISHRQPAAGGAWQPSGEATRPLEGLRVLDLARVWAGPLCTRTLSDLGADVVWVEAPLARGPRHLPQPFIDACSYYPDNEAGERPWNRNGHHAKYAIGKQSLALDLQHEDGQAAFERLVPNAHLLIENFSSRVMPQFGLAEDRLHELNPDLVYVTMPGYGRSGPAEHWLAYGSCVDSHAGLSWLTGYPDAYPWKGGIAWPDPIAGLHACSAALGALWASVHGGGGCTIEAAQFESTIAAIGDRVLEAQVDGPYVPGSTVPGLAVNDTFPCRGVDAWIAVTAHEGAEYHALVDFLDGSSLTEVAAESDATELMRALQARGIAAGVTATAPQLLDDPQLREVGLWWTVLQPDIGNFTVPRTPIDLCVTPIELTGPAPTLGQHNTAVLRHNGFADDEITILAEAGLIVDTPPR